MNKCDFCEKSNSYGICTFNIFTISAYDKDYYCVKAIKRMMKYFRENLEKEDRK